MPTHTDTFEQNVFLNVPFDKSYEDLFLALIATLVSLGRLPRCVLEITEIGQGRLKRIQDLQSDCRVSIHDLSRTGLPVRFNMPFELGLACALQFHKGDHDFILLEKKRFRLDKTLSDLKGCDPLIHEGRPKLLISILLGALSTEQHRPTVDAVIAIFRRLRRVSENIKLRHHQNLVFSRGVFLEAVVAAVTLSVEDGLLESG